MPPSEGLPPFTIGFPRLKCFHEAFVAEVEGDGVYVAAERLVADGGPFLPHLSLAYTTAPGSPAPLRDVLVGLRDTDLGTQDVREVALCSVPASRTTILQPWTVLGTVSLR